MKTGIGLSEILLILALVVIFIDAKQIPNIIKKGFKAWGRLQLEIRKFMNDINK
jgi:Sec-independent protein translocase protein TatA